MTEMFSRTIGTGVGQHPALGAQDHDLLQRRRERGGDLHDAAVAGPQEIVDRAQRLDLDGKGRVRDRIDIGIEPAIGAGGRIGQDAAPAPTASRAVSAARRSEGSSTCVECA
jgi:hypothetical protein